VEEDRFRQKDASHGRRLFLEGRFFDEEPGTSTEGKSEIRSKSDPLFDLKPRRVTLLAEENGGGFYRFSKKSRRGASDDSHGKSREEGIRGEIGLLHAVPAYET